MESVSLPLLEGDVGLDFVFDLSASSTPIHLMIPICFLTLIPLRWTTRTLSPILHEAFIIFLLFGFIRDFRFFSLFFRSARRLIICSRSICAFSSSCGVLSVMLGNLLVDLRDDGDLRGDDFGDTRGDDRGDFRLV